MTLWLVLTVFLCCSTYMTGLAKKYLAEVDDQIVTLPSADEENVGYDYNIWNWAERYIYFVKIALLRSINKDVRIQSAKTLNNIMITMIT